MPKIPYSEEYNSVVMQDAARLGLTGTDFDDYVNTERRLSELDAMMEDTPEAWLEHRNEWLNLCNRMQQLGVA